jgi:hypothetical protein
MSSKKDWVMIKERKPNAQLIFIHTPKCAGSYATKILDKFGIRNKHHHQATTKEGKNI